MQRECAFVPIWRHKVRKTLVGLAPKLENTNQETVGDKSGTRCFGLLLGPQAAVCGQTVLHAH